MTTTTTGEHGSAAATRREEIAPPESGLMAAPLMLVAGFLPPLTGDPSSTASTILYAPMGLQEMVRRGRS